MKRTTTILIALLIAATAATSQAYVEPIHAKITGYAFDRATTESDFMKRYGFQPISLVLRSDMQYGAVHEDDKPNSLHHFFDYQNRVPLTEGAPLLCTPVGIRADQWALNNLIINPHSLFQAHVHMYMALTESNIGGREMYQGLLFEDLGHIVHLLQDMAQPEHTRNDQHLVLGGYGVSFGNVAASIYENWTRDRLVAPNFLPDGTPVESFYVGYPTISDRTYSRYFGDDVEGLAAYSSTYHVTQDTNYDDTSFLLHCESHPLPSKSSAIPRDETTIFNVVDPDTLATTQVPVVETIYRLPFMFDYAAGVNDSDGFHTVESAINHETGQYDPNTKVFSLDEMSWKIRAANLLPKAVGYTASLLKHFFRGRLTSFWTLNDDGTYRLFLHSANDTMSNATVEVYQTDDDGSLTLLNVPPAFGVSFGFLGEVPTPIPAERKGQPIYTKELRVVTKGRLGNEDDAVAAEILPKRHKMKFVVDYDNGIAYQTVGIQAIKQGTGFEDCAGCSTMTFNPMSIPYYSRGIPFSDAKKFPFNGQMDLTVGATDSEAFVVDVVAGTNIFSATQRTATITVYRDDQQTAQLPVLYKTSLRLFVLFKGDGTLSVVENFSN